MIFDMVKHEHVEGFSTDISVISGNFFKSFLLFSTDISVISWNFFKSFLLEIGLICSYKIPPCLLSNLIRALCILTQKIQLELDSPY